MEITREKTGDTLVLRLNGRLDANWCNHVQNALSAAVRDGEHRVHLDMANVGYISSAGIRVLLAFFKQVKAINGVFGVSRGSAAVRSVLELSGLNMLLLGDEAPQETKTDQGASHTSPNARYELFRKDKLFSGIRLEAIGQADVLRRGAEPNTVLAAEFGADAFALGVGALGGSYADCLARFGEFLAVAGTAAFQPSDGSSRPDFVVSQGAFVPEGRLLLGLSGNGVFPLLARFEATGDTRSIGLTELARTALELGGASAVAFVIAAETSCLVGASLRRSPAPKPDGDRFAFPNIRDWLSFTSERAFRDSTSLVVGVAAKPGTAFDPLLRPLGRTSGIVAHAHAAVFPYRPLRKGRVELKALAAELFDGSALQAVLHLLTDPRGINGAGESEFYRGAMWVAPVEGTS